MLRQQQLYRQRTKRLFIVRTGNERLIAISFEKEKVSTLSCHPCHDTDNVVKNNKNSDDIAKKHLSHIKSLLTGVTKTERSCHLPDLNPPDRDRSDKRFHRSLES